MNQREIIRAEMVFSPAVNVLFSKAPKKKSSFNGSLFYVEHTKTLQIDGKNRTSALYFSVFIALGINLESMRRETESRRREARHGKLSQLGCLFTKAKE